MVNDLVTVESFRVLPEAEAAKLHLEAEGIQAFLAEPEAVDMDWLGGSPLWNVKLQVARGDAERAAVVLSQMRAQWRRRAETAEASEALVCLACGAPMPEEEEASKCAACGWSYAAGESDSAS